MGDYDDMKVDDLRDELEERGLDTQGNKPDLVKRLEADDRGEEAPEPGEYDTASDDDLRSTLAEKGLPTDGDRALLLSRLQANAGTEEGTKPQEVDRKKQHPGAGDERQTRSTTAWEDPSKRGEETGFVSTADTKPGSTNAVDEKRQHVPATPSS